MLSIPKTSNNRISDMSYSGYTRDENIRRILNNLGCVTFSEAENYINVFLEARFDRLKTELKERLLKLKKTL